jgi:hypothetical protein
MARQLSIRAINLVLRLCEQRRAEIAGHVLRMHFGGVGDELIAAGALVETAPSEIIFMPIDLDDQPVAFEWESDLQAYAAFHPADGWMDAEGETRRRYRLEFPWLLRSIAQQLEIPAATRSACLVPDLLWDLGDAWFNRRKATVLFGRRLGQVEGQDLVCDALTRRVGRPPGILLTSTRQMSRHVTVPGQHRVLHLTDCMRADVPEFAIDTEVISGVLSGIIPRRPAQLIDPSPDFRIVRALGQTFTFKGDKQRTIVEHMYYKWRDGADRISTAELIADLGLRERARVCDHFKTHPAWGVLLTEKQGSCWFLV